MFKPIVAICHDPYQSITIYKPIGVKLWRQFGAKTIKTHFQVGKNAGTVQLGQKKLEMSF